MYSALQRSACPSNGLTIYAVIGNDLLEIAAARYEQNEDFFVGMLKEPKMRGQIMQAVGGMLYERLKKRKMAQIQYRAARYNEDLSP